MNQVVKKLSFNNVNYTMNNDVSYIKRNDKDIIFFSHRGMLLVKNNDVEGIGITYTL